MRTTDSESSFVVLRGYSAIPQKKNLLLVLTGGRAWCASSYQDYKAFDSDG